MRTSSQRSIIDCLKINYRPSIEKLFENMYQSVERNRKKEKPLNYCYLIERNQNK